MRDNESLLKAGEIVGNYKIVRRLGRGGMGEVYLAWEEELQRNVAIKILLPEAIGDKDMVERFKGEGRALARLRHPNVIGLYQFGEKGQNPYIVMEYVEGISLDHMIKRHPLGIPEVVQIMKQILGGLAAAHETGIIHRDVKPENVLVDKDLQVKLLDFGIAKVHFDQRSVNTSMDVLIGTMNYVAPEIVAGKTASRQSDIYSAGLTFFYMLQGSIPFDGRNNLAVLEKIRTVDLRFAPNLDLILPDRLKAIVLRMTSRSLNVRYADAREVIRDLETLDLQTLPRELRYSPEPYLEIGNRKEVEDICTKQGFDTAEARVIITLAAGIVAEREKVEQAKDDETTFAGERPEFKIESGDLEQAVAKYRGLKSRMITRRTQKVKRPQKSTPIWQLIAIGLVGFIGAAVVGYKLLWRKDAISRADALAKRRAPASSPAKAAPPAPQAQPNPVLTEVPLLSPEVGTRLEYRIHIRSRRVGTLLTEESWVVAENAGGRMKWLVNGEKTGETSTNPFVPMLESGRLEGREDISRTMFGDDMKIFPLAPGKSFEVTITGRNAAQAGESYDYKCSVAGFSKTKSKVGEFDVVEVNCTASGPGSNYTARYLYAPALRANVLYERKGRQEGALIMTRELIGYRKP